MKLLSLLLLPFFALGAADRERLVVHLLSYVASDYTGALTNPSEFQEQVDLLASARQEAALSPVLSQHPRFLQELNALSDRVSARAPASQVETKARELAQNVVVLAKLPIAPKQWPDRKNGHVLYVQNCAQCHGAKGLGDGPSSGGLDPKPTDFFSSKMEGVSPFQAFNTIRLGVPNTSMAAFDLPEAQVWDLAFYVIGLRHEVAKKTTAALTLEEVAVLSDEELKQKISPAEIAYLRTERPKAVTLSLGIARQKFRLAQSALDSNDFLLAEREVLAAYLDGIEPVEAELRWKDMALLTGVEAQVSEVRKAIRGQDAASASAAIAKVLPILESIETKLTEEQSSGPLSAVLAGGIVLREAFEAVLVIITLLGALRGTPNPRRPRVAIHSGWVAALAFGIAAWFFSGWVMQLSGWKREVLEGTVALLAVSLLAYVGVWLHQRAEIQKWHIYIKEKLSEAVTGQKLVGLWLISFMAVFREALETVLFLRALLLDSSAAQGVWIWGGVLGSFVLVVGMAWALLVMSRKLPLRQLFALSSGVIIFLALILAGKGIRAFQEAGLIPVSEFASFLRFDFLGIYPSVETLLAQVIVGILLGGLLYWVRRQTRLQMGTNVVQKPSRD